jgi:hypothetical protein
MTLRAASGSLGYYAGLPCSYPCGPAPSAIATILAGRIAAAVDRKFFCLFVRRLRPKITGKGWLGGAILVGSKG